ncbi:RNA polymerase sigma factor RpoD/SigA [Nocardioides KLBMP 9356]|uniref:RNA polymerase sigma factor RpoD/SigA n=1 Tax=Nocardioides potassii TaxID=2911371 RepID=A0ABS9H8S1_9ACTN|nr:RNA polymerase sigma factor RpoD/SigA [Nocardioides potassii]MCF6376418.1 RNA polymerase sigma factor RpoD/SigA [Nocardioides potassii]
MTPDIRQQLLAALASRLDGASIKRSAVEEAILSASGGVGLRAHVDQLLAEAGIEVVEDVVVEVDPMPPATQPAPVVAVDPIQAARRRLELDRGRAPDRLAKIILKAEEEVGLTLLARPDGVQLDAGGFAHLEGEAKEAADAMVLHNMGLIHSVAQRLGGQGLEYDDLVASGIPGLVRAVEKFDPYRGLKFSTYAMHWVRQSITRAIDNEGRVVRLPVHVIESIRQVKAAQERLTVDGKMPAWSEIAKACHMSVDRVEELLMLAPAVVSLDKPVGNDGITLGDLVDRPVRREPVEVHGMDGDDLQPLLDCLVEREADILRRRHGLPPYDDSATLDDIGKVYGVTRERIRQIETKAMKNIRKVLGVEDPKKATAEAQESQEAS